MHVSLAFTLLNRALAQWIILDSSPEATETLDIIAVNMLSHPFYPASELQMSCQSHSFETTLMHHRVCLSFTDFASYLGHK